MSSDIHMKLSDYYVEGENLAYHDWVFRTFGHRGSNSDETQITVSNECGNPLAVAVWKNGKIVLIEDDISKIEIRIQGGIEYANLIHALRYMLNAEKMMAKIDP